MTATGDRARVAQRLREEREARGWGKRRMARELLRALGAPVELRRVNSLDRQMIDWESGKHFPRDRTAAYATAFGLDEAELFGDLSIEVPPAVSLEGTTIAPDDWDDMERRRLLLAALGVGAGAFGSSGESVRQLLDLAVESELRPIEDWGLACVDHLHALRTRPPAQVREGLAVDLLALHRQLKTADPQHALELKRFLAALAMLHAHALSRLGDHGSAIHWWRTARSAADATGDLDLRLMVRCEEAKVGLYGQRDLATVLHLVEAAGRITGDRPSFWRADLAGTRAKALTLRGRHGEALQALHTFVSYGGPDGRASIFPALWNFDQAAFAQSWVHASMGSEVAADKARDLVLSSNGDSQYGANVRLHEALCTVVNGGIDQGTQQAATVLDALPVPYRSQMITETGRMVLQAVPVDQRQRPRVGEFREVLAATTPKLLHLPSR